MEFCDNCGSMMKTRDGVWECTRCDYTQLRDETADFVVTAEQEDGGVIETNDEAEERGLPTANDVSCDECGHDEAYWYLQQTRAADESETRFFICTACENQWRGYD